MQQPQSANEQKQPMAPSP